MERIGRKHVSRLTDQMSGRPRDGVQIGMATAATTLALARSFCVRGEFIEAVAHYKEVLRAWPSDGTRARVLREIHVVVGGVYLELDRTDLALAHIDKAASLGAHEASMCRVLGHACLHARENDAALAYYRRQAEVEPESGETWSQIAEVALKLGNMKLAALASEAAQRLDPADPWIQITLGNVASAEGRLDEAMARYRFSATIDPQFPAALVCMGSIYVEKGEFQSALEIFTEALAIAPEDCDALYGAAVSHIRLDREQEAIPILRSALAIDPGHPQSSEVLIILLLRSRHWLEAGCVAMRAAKVQRSRRARSDRLAKALRARGYLNEHKYTSGPSDLEY